MSYRVHTVGYRGGGGYIDTRVRKKAKGAHLDHQRLLWCGPCSVASWTRRQADVGKDDAGGYRGRAIGLFWSVELGF